MSGDEVNWREKCIDEFELLPIPEKWGVPDTVSIATNDVWRAYYSHRMACKKREDTLYDEKDEYGDLLDEFGDLKKSLATECLGGLETAEEEARGEDWTKDGEYPWCRNTYIEVVRFEPEYGDTTLQTAKYKAIVWSRYAIPRAIELEHRYHCRPRYSTVEFYATWAYRFKSYDEVFSTGGMVELCSNHYEDEALRLDTIDASGLTKRVVKNMRKHLNGTSSSHGDLSDFAFMQLIFASMATPGFDTVEGSVGHEWYPPYGSGLKKKLVAEGIVSNENDIKGIKWLEYEVRRATGALRPIDNYYQPPKKEDAPGYDSQEDYVSDDEHYGRW